MAVARYEIKVGVVSIFHLETGELFVFGEIITCAVGKQTNFLICDLNAAADKFYNFF